MLKKKLIYLEILASLLLYGCSPSVKQTQAAAEKTTIEVETTAEAKEPEIPYIEAADSFAGGSGTEEDPYQIATAEQLALMGKVNDDWAPEYNKAYYVLTADIQLNDVENYENWKETPPEYQWKPVGDSFKGNFDGDGHVISGMYVRSVEDCYYIGLFSYLSSGSISNVNIEKGFLYVKDSGIDAGGLVGDALGNVKVENCSVDIDACSEVTNGTDQVGGIVGYCQNGVVITGCTFHGDISYQDSHGIFGGICGTASKSSIINCETTGSVRVRDGQEFPFFEGGGICGRADNTKIDRCINRMDMSGRFYELGGICAIQTIGKISISHKNSETTYENGSVEITDCINYGNLQADTKDGVVGGIVGEVYTRDFQADNLKIENCENYADITGKTTIGGIIGELDIGAIKYSIRNCRNDGNVTAENWSGGIIGKLFSTVEGSKISGCTNNGQVTAGAPNGGIIGAYWGFTLGFKESSRGTLYIEKCKNTGKIICDSGILGTGGILGLLSIDKETEGVWFTGCINTGTILMNESGRLGGILGHVDYSKETSESWTIEDCANTGAIQYRDGTESFGEKLKDAIYKDAKESSEKANIMMGGSCMGEIAGEMKGGFIKNCLAAGDIRVNENYSGYAGAICGQVFFTGDNSEEKCYISDCKYLNKYPFAAMVPLAHENDQSVQNTEGISEEEAEVLLQRWGL